MKATLCLFALSIGLTGCGLIMTPSEAICDEAICYRLVDGLAVAEGDIVIGTVEEMAERKRRIRTGIVVPATVSWGRWPKGRVPYRIAATLPEPERVLRAIEHFHATTNLTFLPRTTQTAYVLFRPWAKGYCQSWIGRNGSAQAIDLDTGCDTRSVIHELGHALGLWHEHTRSDRDKYVKIVRDNVIPNLLHNFSKQLTYSQLIGPYDFSSVMHYRPYELSRNGGPTVTKLDGSTNGLSNPVGLSEGDIKTLRYMYPTKNP